MNPTRDGCLRTEPPYHETSYIRHLIKVINFDYQLFTSVWGKIK